MAVDCHFFYSRMQINNIIDERASIVGTFEFEGTLRIDGRLTGKLQTNGQVIIGRSARLAAEIFADSVVVDMVKPPSRGYRLKNTHA